MRVGTVNARILMSWTCDTSFVNVVTVCYDAAQYRMAAWGNKGMVAVAREMYELLFSQNYLEHRLRRQYTSTLVDLMPRARHAWEELCGRWARESNNLSALNEDETEDRWIKPLLDELWPESYVVQRGLGGHRPDYVFFAEQRARDAAQQVPTTLFESAVALGEAEAWRKDLSRRNARHLLLVETPESVLDQRSDRETPYEQILRYLNTFPPTWGIVTNGHQWRLCAQNVRTADKAYYEVDLVDILLRQDFDAFQSFFLLFECGAFTDGRLTDIQRDSNVYAVEVGAQLSTQVFSALEALANGWVEHDPSLAQSAAGRRRLYDSGLIYLYRLLFILYAESRDLLPRRDSIYHDDYGLDRLVERLAAEQPLDQQQPSGHYLWQRLCKLFAALDQGRPARVAAEPPLNALDSGTIIPAYNGGLFKPNGVSGLDTALVDAVPLPNSALGAALRALAIVNGARVDYSDLRIQQLGTMYEGLLEQELQLCVSINTDEPPIALTRNRRRRREQGGFYTPDAAVDYIVEQTLKPLVMRQHENRVTYRSPDQILRLRVLDPAMGSGHFLVSALNYLTVALGEARRQSHGLVLSEADDTEDKRQIAERCLYGVDRNPLAVELAKLAVWLATADAGKPLSFLDHHLQCGDSLLGLTIRQVGSPPVASSRQRREERSGQASLYEQRLNAHLPDVMKELFIILRTPSDDLEQVRRKGQASAAIAARVAPFVITADTRAAIASGMPATTEEYATLLDKLDDPTAFEQDPLAQRLRDPNRAYAKLPFLHWELAFPDVFFQWDERRGVQRLPEGQAGFDAIVGNPPYVRSALLGAYKSFFKGYYQRVYGGGADLYVYFIERSLQLLKARGRLGFIGSSSWLRAGYAGKLRRHLRVQVTFESLVDLGDTRVFADAPDVYTAIPIIVKAPPPPGYDTQVAVFTRPARDLAALKGVVGLAAELATDALRERSFSLRIDEQPDQGWDLAPNDVQVLLRRMRAAGRPLADIVGDHMYSGIKTGDTDVFVVDRATRDRLVAEDPGSAAILEPFAQGRDMRRWFVEDTERWLILAYRGIDLDQFPAIEAYLAPFRGQLEPRPSNWLGEGPWTGRKAGDYQWYELQDPVEYHAEFKRPKIVYPDIANYPRFAWEESGLYLGNTGFAIIEPAPWILGFLGSRCAWFLLAHDAKYFEERAGLQRRRLFDEHMRRLHVPNLEPSARAALGRLATDLTKLASERHALDRAVQRRILTDLGRGHGRLNQKLARWWDASLTFAHFQEELRRNFRVHIPVEERDEWERWFDARSGDHAALTERIIDRERQIDERIYEAYGLTADERLRVEHETAYTYGIA